MNTPGANSLDAPSATTAEDQPVPGPTCKRLGHADPSWQCTFDQLLALRRDRRSASCSARTAAARAASCRPRIAEGRLGDLGDAGRAMPGCSIGFHRQHDDLLVRRIRQLPERLDVFVGDEVVQRRRRRPWQWRRRPSASPWPPLRRIARAPRRRGTRLRGGLRPAGSAPAWRLRRAGFPTAAGLQPAGCRARLTRSAFICRPIASTRSAGGTMSLISMRLTFRSPRRDRGIDHAQQPLVDLVAMRQHLIEIHRSHHRADVGHGQDDDRLIEIGDLVARLRGIEHLDRTRRRPPSRWRCPW